MHKEKCMAKGYYSRMNMIKQPKALVFENEEAKPMIYDPN